jgi:putative FmdB family regulatory protein
MPIYEYRCRKCGTEFELMRPLAQRDAAARCTNCGSRATSRKLSLFSVVRADPGGAEGPDGDSDGDDDWEDDDF